MLTPEYLSSVPDAMAELYAGAEKDILADMARRMSGFDIHISSAQYQEKALEEMGAVRGNILSTLSQLTGESKKTLSKTMREAGMETLAADEAIYKAAGLSSSPATTAAVQETLAAGLKKTNGLFKNLTKSTARTAAKQFEKALNQAYMQVSSGAIDPATAVKGALKDLAKQGVGAVEHSGGRVDGIETAVRRATAAGVNQTCLKMQEARADELGVDLVETTAHAGARPSHAVWQGQIFSRSGKSTKYPDFVRSTGYGTGAGLGGWNCSHSFRPYIEGMPRRYSQEQLDEYANKRYTVNGREMTEYEALQKQRTIERKVRRYERETDALKAAGLDASESAAKLRKWQDARKDFAGKTGLGWDAGKISKGALKPIQTGDLKVISTRTPAVANNEWLARGYEKPPYDPSFETKIVQAGSEGYVRVFSFNPDGTSNKLGRWIMRKSDVEGLTPTQIADKYALPKRPTHICDVSVQPDYELQTGIANKVDGWGQGGGQQFDTMEKRLPQLSFVNERLIGES